MPLRELGRIVRNTDAITGGPGLLMRRPTTAPPAPGDDLCDTLRHVRDLGEKDLTLALELAGELGVDVPLARLAKEGLSPGLGLPEDAPDGRPTGEGDGNH